MAKQVDTQKYTEFVDAVTSQESKDYITFNSRCFGIQSEESGDGLPKLLCSNLTRIVSFLNTGCGVTVLPSSMYSTHEVVFGSTTGTYFTSLGILLRCCKFF